MNRYVFAENPIIIRQEGQVQPISVAGVPITVQCGGQSFVGSFCPPLDVDISDIVSAMVRPMPDAYEGRVYQAPLARIESPVDIADRLVTVSIEGGQVDSFYALPGGISRQNLRLYRLKNSDIFTDRFLNYGGNFFLTTRSANWKIIIPETELYPLYFIADSATMGLEFRELATGSVKRYGVWSKGIYALNIDRLRRLFVADGILANAFDVYTYDEGQDTEFACRIAVARVVPGMDSHVIRYRTSLGVFDLIDLRGTISYEAEGVATDPYNVFDGSVGDFARRRDRMPSVSLCRISTGLRHISSLRLLCDMLASDEVYLGGVRVVPEIPEEFTASADVPNEFTVTFRAVDDERFFVPDVTDLGGTERKRVHSDEFDVQFN